MKDKPKGDQGVAHEPAVSLAGTVEKIIPSIRSNEPGMAQITLEGTEEPYREICVDSTSQDGVSLKVGAQVKVKIEAGPEATTPKKQASAKESAEQLSLAKE